ncbi:MAG: acetylxylan esterase, partial [Clostridiales bacterium]|nr:acetylxylan esterase [Clostridiales bacterium]
EYRGINPRPRDFDRFWAEGLAEIKSIEPETAFVKAAVDLNGLDAENVYFTSAKGSRIRALYVAPKDRTKKYPVMLLFHGYGGNSGSFFDKAAFAGQGYIVLAMDCRGQRGLSDNGVSVKGTEQTGLIMRGFDDPDPTNLYFRNVFLDTVQLVKVAKSLPHADPGRIYAHGGSQGGALTVACAALCGGDIKKAGAVFPFLCDYQRVWAMDLAEHAYCDIKDYLRAYAPFEGKQAHVWEKLGYIDLQHLADRISAEVLWATGLMDNICPPSSQFAAYNKIKAKKEMLLYTNHGHEGLPDLADLMSGFFNAGTFQ